MNGTSVEDGERRSADLASTRLAQLFERVADECKGGADERVCATTTFVRMRDDIVADYQRYYSKHHDPLESSGRIDALPRLGGPQATDADVRERIAWHCGDRCSLERRMRLGELESAAVNACVAGEGLAACAKIATEFRDASATDSVEVTMQRCERRCTERRIEAEIEAARERNRPRTRAQSEACFRRCARRCEKTWCGTCEATCRSDCATARAE